MGSIRDLINSIFADGPTATPTEPSKPRIRNEFAPLLETSLVGAAAGLVRSATLAGLGSGTRVSQPGEVTAGPDKGAYSWSGSTWVRVGDLIDPAALQTQITNVQSDLYASLNSVRDDLYSSLNNVQTSLQGQVTDVSNRAHWRLGSYSNTGNDAVATATPTITALSFGQSFWITAQFTNTGPMTLNISGLGALPLNDRDGNPIPANLFVQGRRYLINPWGPSATPTMFRVISDNLRVDDVDTALLDAVGRVRGWPLKARAGIVARPHRHPGGLAISRPSVSSERDEGGSIVPTQVGQLGHDFDPLTGEYRGIRFDPPSVNLITYSSDITNAAWTKARVTAYADQYWSPGNALSGDAMIETTDTGVHAVTRTGIAVTNGDVCVASFFVKSIAGRDAMIQFDGAGMGTTNPVRTAFFNLATGTVAQTSSGVTASIRAYRDGWYRITAITAAAATDVMRVFVASAIGLTYGHTGEVGKGLALWGAQLEKTSSPTGLLDTGAAAVARAFTALSQFVGYGTEGTLLARFRLSAFKTITADEWTHVASFYVDENNRAHIGVYSDGRPYFGIVANGVTATLEATTPISLNEEHCIAIAWSFGYCAIAVDGNFITSQVVSGQISGTGSIFVGSREGFSRQINGSISEAVLFPRAMTNAQLQNVTLAAGSEAASYVVSAQYVEAGSDLSKDMLVTWHAPSGSPTAVEYRALGSGSWMSAGALSRGIDNSGGLACYTAKLAGLSADTVYEWRPASSGGLFTRRFRTAPEYLSRDLRIAIVSDAQDPQTMYVDGTSVFNQITNLVGADQPDLIVINGDMAADDGVKSATTWGYWKDFIAAISSRWVRSDGTMIPIVAMTGNHEVSNSGAGWYNGNAARGYVDVLFSSLYRSQWSNVGKQGGYGYFSIGKELLVICLESNHAVPIATQISWLTDVMANKAPAYRHVVVAIHVPPWSYLNSQWDSPSIGNWGAVSQMVRRQVLPLVQDAPNVRIVATAHLHQILATPLIKTDPAETGTQQRWKGDASGIRVIGTGGWIGAYQQPMETAGRVSDIDGSSWLDMCLSTIGPTVKNITPISTPTGDGLDPAIKHFWRIDLQASQIVASCININGGVYKTYTDTVS